VSSRAAGAAATLAVLAAALAGCPATRPVVRRAPPPLAGAAPSPPPIPLGSPAGHDEPGVQGVVHVVRRGETLYRIARAYGIDAADLLETNGIDDPRTLAVGAELFVPGATEVVEVPELAAVESAAPGAGGAGTARGLPSPPLRARPEAEPLVASLPGAERGPPSPRPSPPLRARPEDEPLVASLPGAERGPPSPRPSPPLRARPEDEPLVASLPGAERGPPSPRPSPPLRGGEGVLQSTSTSTSTSTPTSTSTSTPTPTSTSTRSGGPPLAWPLHGVLYGRFGVRAGARHDGIDIAAPEGTAVRAAADGTAVYVGEPPGYGAVVILRHAGGLVTVYAHNAAVLVREGARVTRGEAIAKVGQTGRTTGPHLHFEVREGSRPRNPLLYLP
jgi:lipoprotein NlpD